MKNWKRIAAGVLAIAMGLTAVGCSQETKTETSASAEIEEAISDAVEEAVASQEATASETTEEVASDSTVATDKVFKIGIVQIAEHGSLDAAREGFISRLDELGVPYEVDVQNAQNDMSNMKAIAQRFITNDVDLILAIATPTVQVVSAETTTIPILGTAVTDYVDANLVQSNEAPGANVSGTSDMITELDKQLSLIPILKPDAKKVGLLYTTSETNSLLQINQAKEVLDKLGYEYKDYGITSSNDITQIMATMNGQVDVVYAPTDNTVAAAMGAVSQNSANYQLPVITGSTDMVKDGGTATFGINYFELGRQTADMAKRILVDGEAISTMPIETSTAYNFVYNDELVKELGITLPEDLLAQAVTE